MHVFHDPLANGGGGINRRCSVEESSAISPVLEKMEEHVYTTKHLVSYRTILSMEANNHEATLQLTVVLRWTRKDGTLTSCRGWSSH